MNNLYHEIGIRGSGQEELEAVFQEVVGGEQLQIPIWSQQPVRKEAFLYPMGIRDPSPLGEEEGPFQPHLISWDGFFDENE